MNLITRFLLCTAAGCALFIAAPAIASAPTPPTPTVGACNQQLDRFSDGSGMLFVDGVPNWFFEADTFPRTELLPNPMPLIELPRTR